MAAWQQGCPGMPRPTATPALLVLALTIGVGVGSLLVRHDPGRGVVHLQREGMGAQHLWAAGLARPQSRARSAALGARCCCFRCRSEGCQPHGGRHGKSLCPQLPRCDAVLPIPLASTGLPAPAMSIGRAAGRYPDRGSAMLRLSPDVPLPGSAASCPHPVPNPACRKDTLVAGVRATPASVRELLPGFVGPRSLRGTAHPQGIAVPCQAALPCTQHC